MNTIDWTKPIRTTAMREAKFVRELLGDKHYRFLVIVDGGAYETPVVSNAWGSVAGESVTLENLPLPIIGCWARWWQRMDMVGARPVLHVYMTEQAMDRSRDLMILNHRPIGMPFFIECKPEDIT